MIGPEKPLVDGLTDYLESFNIKVFGPSKVASQLEGSKIFTKNICKKYNIPTANFGVFNDINQAQNSSPEIFKPNSNLTQLSSNALKTLNAVSKLSPELGKTLIPTAVNDLIVALEADITSPQVSDPVKTLASEMVKIKANSFSQLTVPSGR